MLYASSAVGGTVAGDERGGRLVAEVDPWSDLREGVTDSVQDGRAVYAVESILDVNEHHDFVCVAAVPVHPLPCCAYDAFRSMRSSDANLQGFENVLDHASHHLKSNLLSEPAEGLNRTLREQLHDLHQQTQKLVSSG